MRCSTTDQGWCSGVSSRPFIYWPNAPQKQLPYNLGFVCFPVIPGGDEQEATLQDHSSRTNTAVIYKGHQMQGSNSEKKEEQGKWSLPGEEEAQSWRKFCRGSRQLFFGKLSVSIPLKIDSLLEVLHYCSNYDALLSYHNSYEITEAFFF